MQHNIIKARYGEIALKGRNLKDFENKLIQNIKDVLDKNNIAYYKIKNRHKKIIIYTKKKTPCLAYVFGLTSFSHAIETELDIKKIKKTALSFAKKIKNTFRITSKRSNKNFPLNSMELNNYIGKIVLEKTKKKVDLKNPETTIFIDIADKAYIYNKKIYCVGGLPLGIEGKVVSLIKDKASLVASFLAMKRGCKLIPVSYKKQNINLLKKFDNKIKLSIIKKLDDIDKIAQNLGAQSVIVSQTYNNFKQLPLKTPILRPLISYNRKELDDLYKKINSM